MALLSRGAIATLLSLTALACAGRPAEAPDDARDEPDAGNNVVDAGSDVVDAGPVVDCATDPADFVFERNVQTCDGTAFCIERVSGGGSPAGGPATLQIRGSPPTSLQVLVNDEQAEVLGVSPTFISVFLPPLQVEGPLLVPVSVAVVDADTSEVVASLADAFAYIRKPPIPTFQVDAFNPDWLPPELAAPCARRATITMRNEGDMPLVGSLATESAGFTIEDSTCAADLALEPGERCSAALCFSGGPSGEHEGVVRVQWASCTLEASSAVRVAPPATELDTAFGVVRLSPFGTPRLITPHLGGLFVDFVQIDALGGAESTSVAGEPPRVAQHVASSGAALYLDGGKPTSGDCCALGKLDSTFTVEWVVDLNAHIDFGARGIAVLSNETVLAAGANFIQAFDSDGVPQLSWGEAGGKSPIPTPPSPFSLLFVDPFDRLIIGAPVSNGIRLARLSATGADDPTFNAATIPGARFALAFEGDDIWVASSNDDVGTWITKLDEAGQMVTQIDARPFLDDAQPAGPALVIEQSGDLLLGTQSGVHRFTSDGLFLGRVGLSTGPTGFAFPAACPADGGGCFIVGSTGAENYVIRLSP